MSRADTDIDTAYVTKLVLAATSDQKMYRLAQQSIRSLQRKVKSGRLDEAKAPKIFQNVYLDQARAYCEQQTGFRQRMTKVEKELFGKLVYDHYRGEIFSFLNSEVLAKFYLNELGVIKSALSFFRWHVSEEAPHIIKGVQETISKVDSLLKDQ